MWPCVTYTSVYGMLYIFANLLIDEIALHAQGKVKELAVALLGVLTQVRPNAAKLKLHTTKQVYTWL